MTSATFEPDLAEPAIVAACLEGKLDEVQDQFAGPDVLHDASVEDANRLPRVSADDNQRVPRPAAVAAASANQFLRREIALASPQLGHRQHGAFFSDEYAGQTVADVIGVVVAEDRDASLQEGGFVCLGVTILQHKQTGQHQCNSTWHCRVSTSMSVYAQPPATLNAGVICRPPSLSLSFRLQTDVI